MTRLAIVLNFCTFWTSFILGCGTVNSSFAQAGYQRLHSFGFPERSGTKPLILIEANDGKLYGVTRYGGTNSATFNGINDVSSSVRTNDGGVLFRVNKDGSDYLVIHHFLLEQGDHYHYSETGEGGGNNATLLEGADGFLYGTFLGDTNDPGTLYRINRDGSGYSILHSFGEVERMDVTIWRN